MGRKIILVLCLLLVAGQAWGAGTKLDIVDYSTRDYLMCDGTYFYSGTSRTVMRNAVSDGTASTGKAFSVGYENTMFWSGSAAGEIFIQVWETGTNKYFLYRSLDYGVHVGANATADDDNPVLLIGYDDNQAEGTHVAKIYLLARSFAYDPYRNQYLVLEYNVADSRTAGGDNDRVRLMKSANGYTWAEVASWNNDALGNNNVSHGHGIKVTSDYVYIMFGDGDTKSGILRWDGDAALVSNQNLDQYSNCLQGNEKVRTVDIIETDSHLIWFADNHDATDHGIYKISKTAAAFAIANIELVNGDVMDLGSRDGFYGVLTSTGSIFFTEQNQDTTSTNVGYGQIYSSNDGGNTFGVVAYVGAQDLTGGKTQYFTNIYEYGGRIYLPTKTNFSGKNTYDTIICQEYGAYSEASPVVIHPVYWVSATGNNANSGFSPTAAKLTLENALEGNVITYGARVIVGAGTFDESYIVAAFSGNALSGLSTLTTTIEGQGDTLSILQHPNTDGNLQFFQFNSATSGNITFKNLKFLDLKANSKVFGSQVAVTYEDCYIGGSTDASGSNYLFTGGFVISKRTTWHKGSKSSSALRPYGGTFYGYESIFINANKVFFYGDSSTALELYNCVFYNFNSNAIEVQSGGTTSIPVVKNCIFYGDGDGYAYSDLMGQTETAATLNYNVLYGCTLSAVTSGICDGTGDGCKIATDPRFRDLDTLDFRLSAGSPAIDAGVAWQTYAEAQAAGVTVYGAAPDIGAYEYRKMESTIIPRPIIFDAPQPPCLSTNAACYVQ